MEPMPLSQDSDCYHPPLSADLYQVGPLSPISEEASTPKTATPRTVKDAHDSHLQQESFDAQENIARPGDADQTRPAHTTSAKVGLQITDNVLILTDKLLSVTKDLYSMADDRFASAEDMFQIPRTFCTQIDEEIEEDGATGSTDMSYLRKHLKLAENRLQIAQSGVALAENRLTLAKSQLALAGSRVKYLKDHIEAAKEKRRFDQY
ncbi:hypothetical protein LTR47_008370 [Exophiala xenobiotica]|nr:hypothetical protein LTR41_001371 [Exophiala xenobiotica]KAK5227799.1 hypothetical protein LTR47_008370 [Exophiala xenobiotica]KAK5253479.1 hypothetical protein LTS06_002190 [Exophiala xenobiotica]KAK5346618.1 hypothetical protein LTR61_009566 [Exophiala xenobiotica]KAK5360439.1 hypothetical protein LTR11_010267 [Exophiala xenobiotica]